MKLKNLDKKGYEIFKNKISSRSNRDLFNALNSFCKFYSPGLFRKKYRKKWLDAEFSNDLIYLRKKNKNVFAAMYDSLDRSSLLYNLCYTNDLHKLAAKILKTNDKHLGIRDPKLRMDVPKDKRNSYGWHQDSAYSDLNKDPKNELVFWIPLINTNTKNGTLIVKPKSHEIYGNISYLKRTDGKFMSQQHIIKNRYLKKFKSKSVNVLANSALVIFANLFHKSGVNSSKKVRFAIRVSFYKILSKDFKHYRENLKYINSLNKK